MMTVRIIASHAGSQAAMPAAAAGGAGVLNSFCWPAGHRFVSLRIAGGLHAAWSRQARRNTAQRSRERCKCGGSWPARMSRALLQDSRSACRTQLAAGPTLTLAEASQLGGGSHY